MSDTLTIAEAERVTGLSKDQLRVWERRYGFPSPLRNVHGERAYSGDDVAKLRVVRRLLDQGLRPSRTLGLPVAELEALSYSGTGMQRTAAQDLALFLLKTHQTGELRRELSQSMMREGVSRFVTETAAPLTVLVGEAWMRGELRVFEEHLFTELLQGLLRAAIGQCAGVNGAPRILLTTLPSEPHGLGMLMAEALCAPEGADCVPLGLQTPVAEVVAAAAAKEVHVVALSFSSNFPAAQMSNDLTGLRASLPSEVALWCGGSGVVRAKRMPPGVERLEGLHEIGPAISAWRERAHGTSKTRG